jgi:hypothetical protein
MLFDGLDAWKYEPQVAIVPTKEAHGHGSGSFTMFNKQE